MTPEAALDIGVQGLIIAAKLAAPLLITALVVAGNWMISEIVSFTHTMFDRIPQLLGG
jgi:flagellar biosynthetic protein FliQ